jgi:glycosyltransferase involved in cell wall biosynthesis
MKIAIFVHCFFPEHFYGTETYTLELARNLKEMGHEPIIVAAAFPGEPQRENIVTNYEFEGIPVYCIDKNYYPDIRVKDTYYQPHMRSVFKELLVKINPDIVHVTHLINHTAVLLEVIAELNLPVIATLTDFFGFCFNNKLEAADGSLCHGPDSSRTNCLACLLKVQSVHPNMTILERLAVGNYPLSLLTAFLANTLRRLPGLRKGKLAGFVLDITMRPDILAACYSTYKAVIAPTKFLRDAYIANGLKAPVHLSNFGVDIPRQPKPLKEPGSPIKFGFIGQIAPHKGTDILIDAFRQLPAGSAELLIYGPKDQDPGYMARLTEKAEGFKVFFKGTFPKDKITDVLADLDFLVIPSTWYENSPLVLLNSLATHTPVIVSNVEGMTDFVEDGKNGYIFDRGSINDLARVLHRIVEEPLKARGMSKTTNYPRTTKMMVEDVVNVYGTVLGK